MNPYRGPYRITQKFGPSSVSVEPPYTWNGQYYPRFHKGIDLAGSPSHCPIYATTPQSVIDRGQDSTKALFVRTRDAQGRWHIYYHLYAISVSKGDNIDNSIQVGLQGSTGNSSGPHLHYAVYEPGPWKGTEKNTPIDPTPFLEGDNEMFDDLTVRRAVEGVRAEFLPKQKPSKQTIDADVKAVQIAEGSGQFLKDIHAALLEEQASDSKKLKDLKTYIERL